MDDSEPPILNQACRDYIEGLLRLEPPQLADIDSQYEARPGAQPPVGPQVAAFLAWLVELMQAQRVLELGTALGYSTLALAAALRRTGGRLTAVELDPGMVQATAANLRAAGLEDQVELVHGDAAEVLQELDGPYDLILQDAAKELYPILLPHCLELLRPGGVLAMDDALFRPMGVRAEFADPVHEAVQALFDDPRLSVTILPIGDGLAIAHKRLPCP